MKSVNITLCDKSTFADVIKLRMLKCGGDHRLSGWARCNHYGLISREAQSLNSATGCMIVKADAGVICFENGGRRHEPRIIF